jgi:hypothetical protein
MDTCHKHAGMTKVRGIPAEYREDDNKRMSISLLTFPFSLLPFPFPIKIRHPFSER